MSGSGDVFREDSYLERNFSEKKQFADLETFRDFLDGVRSGAIPGITIPPCGSGVLHTKICIK